MTKTRPHLQSVCTSIHPTHHFRLILVQGLLNSLGPCSRVHDTTIKIYTIMPNVSTIDTLSDLNWVLCVAWQPLYLSSADPYQISRNSCYKVFPFSLSPKFHPYSPHAQQKLSLSTQGRRQYYDHERPWLSSSSPQNLVLLSSWPRETTAHPLSQSQILYP